LIGSDSAFDSELGYYAVAVGDVITEPYESVEAAVRALNRRGYSTLYSATRGFTLFRGAKVLTVYTDVH